MGPTTLAEVVVRYLSPLAPFCTPRHWAPRGVVECLAGSIRLATLGLAEVMGRVVHHVLLVRVRGRVRVRVRVGV